MTEIRNCEQCGAQFEPRREHARFCSALCRITRNRQHTSGRTMRFVRNCMGCYVDPADFIQPLQDSVGGDAPVAAWTWRQVPVPVPGHAAAAFKEFEGVGK
jgi:hypothetical protein